MSRYPTQGVASTGDVTAAATFGTDNRAVRSDGTGKGVQSSGVTIDDSVNVSGIAALSATTIELGHATDTTLARSSAGVVTIEGNVVYAAGGTDVPVADGGTGASTAAGAATNLGLGTGDSPQFTAVNIGHATDTTLARSAAGKATIEGNLILAITDPNADCILIWDDSAGDYVAATYTSNIVISGTAIRAIETHGIALSDETTAITTGTNKATMSLPYAFTVTEVYATLNTVSSSGIPTVDINEAGVTILSTKLTIDASEKTSATAVAAAVISDAAIAANAEIGFDIDVAGTGAKGLKVFIRGYPT